MEQKKIALEIVLVIAFSLAVLLVVSLYGKTHVVYEQQPLLKVIPEPHLAFNAWKEKSMHGRVLFLFDRYLNCEWKDAPVSADNYIYLSVRDNIVREIYHIVPDSSWAEVEKTLKSFPLDADGNGVYRLVLDEWIPVYIMRLKDIAPMREDVLININGNVWADNEVRDIVHLLKKNVLRCDFATLSGRISKDNLGAIREYYADH